jgi:2-amino-4-hydroxy-6-hydroxymethyldihydropteridine diphosphokinase
MALSTSDSQLSTAFIALGANLDHPGRQIEAGIRELAALPQTRVVCRSSLYRSAPVGYCDQPDFINAVVQIETGLKPRELLEALLAIEQRHGRVRDFPNAPRTLDLDIVLYGSLVLHEHGLTIPHPRMHERAFVIVPLAEIAPDAPVPGRGRIADLVWNVDVTEMVKLADVQKSE